MKRKIVQAKSVTTISVELKTDDPKYLALMHEIEELLRHAITSVGSYPLPGETADTFIRIQLGKYVRRWSSVQQTVDGESWFCKHEAYLVMSQHPREAGKSPTSPDVVDSTPTSEVHP